MRFQITPQVKSYERKIQKLEALDIPVTFESLFERVGQRLACNVESYFRQVIERLEQTERYGSADKHRATLSLIRQFRDSDLRFEQLDVAYLREFEIFLRQRGNVNNSIATKLSVLKSVYNQAVSEGVFLLKNHLRKFGVTVSL